MKKIILLCGWLLPMLGLGQQYSIDWHKIAGGGGTSSGGSYSLSGTTGQHDAGSAMSGGNFTLQGGFWSLTALQNAGAPALFIAQSGTDIVLFWQVGTSSYQLESNGDLTTSTWSPVLQPPVTLNQTNYVTNPISAGNYFFRLHLAP